MKQKRKKKMKQKRKEGEKKKRANKKKASKEKGGKKENKKEENEFIFIKKLYRNKATNITCTSTSCMVASANRIANDMQPSITANDFSSCFHNIHRHRNSVKIINEHFSKI